MSETIDYYNKNAKQFCDSTVNVEFTAIQDRLVNRLSEGAFILDFGCGSGRDTRYFMEKGYKVEAIDGSKELCRIASEYTGIPVKHMYFQELDEKEKYDAIWACSSILHLNLSELENVLRKMTRAVKNGGYIYTSFKYGNFSGVRNGRFFTDMTEESFSTLLSQISGLVLDELWITSDARPDRGEEKWLNLILKKQV